MGSPSKLATLISLSKFKSYCKPHRSLRTTFWVNVKYERGTRAKLENLLMVHTKWTPGATLFISSHIPSVSLPLPAFSLGWKE